MVKNGGITLIIDFQVMNVVRVLEVENQHFVTMIVAWFKKESSIAVYFDEEKDICTALKYQYQMTY